MYSNLERPISQGTLRPLRASLEAAQARARDTNAGVLLSRTVMRDRRAPDPNPETFGRYMVWEQAERGFALVALGHAHTLGSAGPARFTGIRHQLDGLLAAAVIEHEVGVPRGLPFALAGFSFDSEHCAVEWAGFPDAMAFVPRLLYTSVGNDRYLTINVVVGAETNLNQAVSSLSEDLACAATPSSNRPGLPCLHEVEPEASDAWHARVRSLTDLIGRGEAEKVVLARRYVVEAEAPIDVASTLDRLRRKYPGCTVFAVRNGDSCFLGATPEMLVRLQDGIVTADCLAGSARRGAGEAEDDAVGAVLLADDKERREHAMVVQGLVESLKGVCESIDVPETPVLKRMANVQHLHTPLRATIKAAQAGPGLGHVISLVERLHPTPAVGGLPREHAVCLIRQHESFDRGWYAGPLGWIDAQGGGEFAVALRSALVEGRRASLYAGCGIVRGSDPAREYEESKLKLSAVLGALGTVLDGQEGKRADGQSRTAQQATEPAYGAPCGGQA